MKKRKSYAPAAALLAVVAAAHAVGAQAPRLAASPAAPPPGGIVRLTLTGPASDPIKSVKGTLSGEPLHFLAAGANAWHAIGGLSADAQGTVVARAFVTRASGHVDTVRASMKLPVIPKPKAEPLKVDSQFSQPMPDSIADRVNGENARARALGTQSHSRPALWTQPFEKPRSSVVTSPFGSGRVFNGALTSRHLGIDFRGKVGEEVHAANRGVVVLVDTFYLAGTVAYIDHGAGVVTGYFHMSKLLVAKGDTVERGQTIGLVGQSGRVTGPHLHWSARYGTITVDPGDLVKLDTSFYSAASGRPRTR